MRVQTLVAAVVIGAWLAPAARGQSISERVSEIRDGQVRMSFAARPGVCGNGRNSISFDGGRISYSRSDDWEADCESGPVRVVLWVRDGRVTGIHTYVGGRWRALGEGDVDLGTVPAPEAVDYLLEVARRSDGGAGKEAILPAVLAADVEVWPELLRIARDQSLPEGTRKSAVFWLGQAAGEEATEGLSEIVYDDEAGSEVRASAIFALSQRPDRGGIPALIRIVRENRDPRLVKKALFWLGQSEDPRALELIEEILLGGR